MFAYFFLSLRLSKDKLRFFNFIFFFGDSLTEKSSLGEFEFLLKDSLFVLAAKLKEESLKFFLLVFILTILSFSFSKFGLISLANFCQISSLFISFNLSSTKNLFSTFSPYFFYKDGSIIFKIIYNFLRFKTYKFKFVFCGRKN